MDALRCDAPRVLYFGFVRAFGRKDEAVVSRRCPLLALESRMHDFIEADMFIIDHLVHEA